MSVVQSFTKVDSIRGLGYILQTDEKGMMKATMSNTSLCCEKFNVYVMYQSQNMHDRLHEFVGKVITKINILPKKKCNRNYDFTRNMEIRFENEDDPLVISFYNEHNGYYQHSCQIEWKNLKNMENKKEEFKL